MNSIVFTIALFLSVYTGMAFASTCLDKKPRNAWINVILTSLAWGFYHWLSN